MLQSFLSPTGFQSFFAASREALERGQRCTPSHALRRLGPQAHCPWASKAASASVSNAAESRICLTYPCLPESIQAVRIQNLCVGGNSIDLEVVRNAQSVSVDILRRKGNLQVRTIY